MGCIIKRCYTCSTGSETLYDTIVSLTCLYYCGFYKSVNLKSRISSQINIKKINDLFGTNYKMIIPHNKLKTRRFGILKVASSAKIGKGYRYIHIWFSVIKTTILVYVCHSDSKNKCLEIDIKMTGKTYHIHVCTCTRSMSVCGFFALISEKYSYLTNNTHKSVPLSTRNLYIPLPYCRIFKQHFYQSDLEGLYSLYM
jgi:hypothetical protein